MPSDTPTIVTSTFNGIGLGPNSSGVFVIGGTNDATYGGDMSNDSAGNGITLSSADSSGTHFALAVYGDDNNTELTTGWVSTIFGSMVIYQAIDTASANVSAFGVTGQLHVGANVASIGNMAGVYGIVECDGSETIAANYFGGLFGATLGASATLSSGYYAGGIMLGGNYAGTTTGLVVGVFFQNPTSSANFDAAFAFGQNSEFAGCVTAAAVGGSNTHKLKVYAGGTLYYIPMYTA